MRENDRLKKTVMENYYRWCPFWGYHLFFRLFYCLKASHKCPKLDLVKIMHCSYAKYKVNS